MHMFIYNTAFFLRWTDKKNLPSRLYTLSLCTYNAEFLDFTHSEARLPFSNPDCNYCKCSSYRPVPLPLCVSISQPISPPRLLPPVTNAQQLVSRQTEGKKSTLKRLTGTGRNTETPCSHPQLECINMYPFPDWCLLFVGDGKNARTQQLVACADRSRGFSFVIEQKKKRHFQFKPHFIDSLGVMRRIRSSEHGGVNSRSIVPDFLTNRLLFPVAVTRQTLTTNTQTNQASHTTLRSCCFFCTFFFLLPL